MSEVIGSKRILLIDDDPTIRSSVGRLLTRLGYVVQEAAGGREGLEAHRPGAFDLVITDINMPEVDGMEVIDALRDQGVPVVAISGGGLTDREMLLDSASLLGAVMTLGKPFLGDELVAVVEAALAKDRGP